jgi:hypothetical protein
VLISFDSNELINLKQKITDHHATEKDKIYGELIALRKKGEVAASEYARMEKSLGRIGSERQHLTSQMQHAQDDAKKYREQVYNISIGRLE